jgi:hypothetical protein
MSLKSYSQSWSPTGVPAEAPKHGLYEEDFAENILCSICASQAGGSWKRYREIVLAVHGVSLPDKKPQPEWSQ